MTPAQLVAAARRAIDAMLVFGAPKDPSTMEKSPFFKPLIAAVTGTPRPELPQSDDFWESWAATLVDRLHRYVNSDAELEAKLDAGGTDPWSQAIVGMYSDQRRIRWAQLSATMEPGRPWRNSLQI